MTSDKDDTLFESTLVSEFSPDYRTPVNTPSHSQYTMYQYYDDPDDRPLPPLANHVFDDTVAIDTSLGNWRNSAATPEEAAHYLYLHSLGLMELLHKDDPKELMAAGRAAFALRNALLNDNSIPSEVKDYARELLDINLIPHLGFEIRGIPTMRGRELMSFKEYTEHLQSTSCKPDELGL